MRRLMLFLAMLLPVSGYTQQMEDMKTIMKFMGAVNPEDVDRYEVERLHDILLRPIRINVASLSALESCGLFTPFQIASIMDYRSRHGDILSFTELSALDGMGEDRVSILAPFISLESHSLPGKRAGNGVPVSNELAVRASARRDVEASYAYGFRYRAEAGECVSFSLSGNCAYDDRAVLPSSLTGNFVWNHRRGKVVAGDFNARFGQGLCMWNSMTVSSLSSPSAFMRRPSGIAASFSFTGATVLTGVAADVNAGKWRASLMLAAPGLKRVRDKPETVSLLPAVNVSRYLRYGHVSVTHVAVLSDFTDRKGAFRVPDMKTSADAAFCIRGVNLYAETAYDWVAKVPAVVCGTDFRTGESLRMAALLRYYPPDFSSVYSGAARSSSKCSNEWGAAVSGEFQKGAWMTVRGAEGFGTGVRRHSGCFSADVAYYPVSKVKDGRRSMQIKMMTDWTFMVSDCIQMKLRVSERFRSWGEPFRTDVRLDFGYISGRVNATMRVNALNCAGTSLLGYLEGGFRGNVLALYLRQGVFKVDNWDDRIYVYERDAPGTFNVPAYYGRGIWTAFSLSWKYARWGKAYLRASYTGYPLMPEQNRKPGRAELKIQFVFRI